MPSPSHQLLFAALLLAGPAQAAPDAQDIRIAPPSWAVSMPPGTAAYAPPVSPLPNWYEVRAGAWQVPLETVREIRALVDARLSANELFGNKARIATYAIQFRGEARDGRRVVRLAGACNVHDTPPWQLSETFFNVNDGGKCYFDAEYDPLEKRLSRFDYHGYA
ncbi:hypothetical protein [Massilia sp. LC238]|uniref:hypothetical protein n=1 Tax=Massilia sp. LC238 TaxID=1502852 RepID=UPI00055EED2B|nr:hypothetical protein [Massilia sp. LC238]